MNKKILLVIIWMIFIFTMSNFKAVESSEQSGMIVNMLNSIFNIENVEILTKIIRKFAHFTEYFILGILVLNCYNNINKKAIILSIVICILYATSDEIHQLFIDGRSCQITDMLIDSFGSINGIFICKYIKNLNKKIFFCKKM